MKKVVSILLLGVSTAEAFTTSSSSSLATSSVSSTSLNEHINTRKRIEGQELGIWQTSCGHGRACDGLSGHERRAMWESYAPVHGSPTSTGAIGCPGGGDWCYASSYGVATPIAGTNAGNKKRAAGIAAALAGLGNGVGGARTDGLGAGSIPKIGAAGLATLALPAASSESHANGALNGEDVREARLSYALDRGNSKNMGFIGEIGAGYGHSPGSSGSSISFSGGGASQPVRARKTGGYGLGNWSPR